MYIIMLYNIVYYIQYYIEYIIFIETTIIIINYNIE